MLYKVQCVGILVSFPYSAANSIMHKLLYLSSKIYHYLFALTRIYFGGFSNSYRTGANLFKRHFCLSTKASAHQFWHSRNNSSRNEDASTWNADILKNNRNSKARSHIPWLIPWQRTEEMPRGSRRRVYHYLIWDNNNKHDILTLSAIYETGKGMHFN